MKRLVLVLLMGGLLAIGAAPAQDKGKDKDKDKEKEKVKEKEKDTDKVVLSWHGQSFFILRTPKGTRIVIDPHDILNYGRLVGLRADLALMTHNHTDHTQLVILDNFTDKKAKDPPTVISGFVVKGKKNDWNIIDTTFKDVKIRTIGVYHDTTEGLQYGKNTISFWKSTAGASHTWATWATSCRRNSWRKSRRMGRSTC